MKGRAARRDVAEVVDRLGAVRSLMKSLKAEEEELSGFLKCEDVQEEYGLSILGRLFSAQVSTVQSSRLDQKLLPPELVEAAKVPYSYVQVKTAPRCAAVGIEGIEGIEGVKPANIVELLLGAVDAKQLAQVI